MNFATNHRGIGPDGDRLPELRLHISAEDVDAEELSLELFNPENPDERIVYEYAPEKVYY
ncbi:hypothetical protein [Halapricum desulfuricans]|uniref:hypothetical protein n=1 Tax=Halapricum desulfuricans TaxID=2841257 RepID=UPI001E363487|nr:hypothetical protein [Halapricum desulfuricans]